MALSKNAQKVYYRLVTADIPMTTAQLFQSMSATWRRKYTRTSINAALDELRDETLIDRTPARRGYRYMSLGTPCQD